jgi:hypothetical protein
MKPSIFGSSGMVTPSVFNTTIGKLEVLNSMGALNHVGVGPKTTELSAMPKDKNALDVKSEDVAV